MKLGGNFGLGDITGLMVQQARDALERTNGQLREALACVESRSEATVDGMVATLRGPLLDDSPSHAAIVSSNGAKALGLPVDEANPTDERWQTVWRLWAKYVALGADYVYEGQTASHVLVP